MKDFSHLDGEWYFARARFQSIERQRAHASRDANALVFRLDDGSRIVLEQSEDDAWQGTLTDDGRVYRVRGILADSSRRFGLTLVDAQALCTVELTRSPPDP